jgi:hypothetical protein
MRGALGILFLVCSFVIISTEAHAQAYPFGLPEVPLTKDDLQEIAKTYQPLLNDDSLPIGTTHEWTNKISGNGGTIQLVKRFKYDYQGSELPCRELRYHVLFKNNSDPYNFTLNRCKIADGSWKIL